MNVVDTHAHFWDMGPLSYPWIAKGSPFDRNFLLEDYWRATESISVDCIVFVECGARVQYSLAETRWAVELAQRDARIQAIIGHVSLLRDDATAALDMMAAMPLVRGIRDNVENKPPRFILQERFVRGVQEVHRRGLHFELCIKRHQLAESIELVRRCPEGSFVLDHCAKPDIRSGSKEPWQEKIRQLAALPNVVCKISGLVTEADWESWKPEEVLWYANAAASAFGPTRIIFGSDWPMNEVAGGYTKWFHLAEELSSSWSSVNREKFFGGNAQRVYRLRPQ